MSLTGPVPENVLRDLETLKLRLAAMDAPDLPAADAQAIAAEISAIRLHLKRLAFDREAMADALKRLEGGRPTPK